MKETIKDWALIFVGCVVVGSILTALGVRVGFFDERPPTPDPDFMLECVYGWGQTPDNCRAILEGDDPPPLPEAEYNQGC